MNEIEKAIETLKDLRIFDDDCDTECEALDIAIEALQEKAEREKGCEYCKLAVEIGAVDSDGVMRVEIGNVGIPFILVNNDTFGTSDLFDINYCPMCGRKLGEKRMSKIDTSLESTKELRQLIIDNPNLPLVIFAGEESWHDCYSYEMTYAHGICIEELTNYKDFYLTKEDFEDMLTDDLACDEEYKILSDVAFNKIIDDMVSKAEFTKCIVIYVG